MTKYKAIVLPDKVYISSVHQEWHVSDLDNGFFFDGQKALPTYKKGWYELPCLPKTVQKKVSPPKIICGYQLKDGFVPTEKLPETLPAEYFEWDDDIEEYRNSEIKGLYDPVYSQEPDRLENIEFEIETIAHKGSNWKFVAAPKNVQHYLIDEITKHPDLLQDERCFLSSEESYRRIREFVKLNINPRAAYVSSDYDFHFEVSKKITLYKKEKYKRCVNAFAKLPKYVDDYRADRKISIYDIIPKEEPRKSYSEHSHVAPKFEGANYEELETNINNYLTELIEKINEPLQDCPHCKGRGVINP